MKKIQKIAILAAILGLAACGDKEAKGGLEQLQNGQNSQEPSTVITQNYQDSIRLMSEKLQAFQISTLSKREQISFLMAKRDSIQGALSQIEMSLQKVNNEKIAPGISGVNSKLNELKGQKENFEEQVALQKKELALAEKKVVLLNEEKEVYDAQKKALYDKGAAPDEFVSVDALLEGINSKLQEQAAKIKNLNRNSSDILEQIGSIDEQRNSLSSKIRNNYTAKQIFDDFSKEEKERLGAQMAAVDEQLKVLVADEDELKKELETYNNSLATLQNKQNSSLEQANKSAQEIAAKEEALKMQNTLEDEAAKKSRVLIGSAIIGVLALLFGFFYYIGKKRKSKKNNI